MSEKNTTKITLARARRGEAETLFVGLNGTNYLVPKGQSVELPAAVAGEIRRSQAADDFYHDAALLLRERQQS